jgi:hypothetical protein
MSLATTTTVMMRIAQPARGHQTRIPTCGSIRCIRRKRPTRILPKDTLKFSRERANMRPTGVEIKLVCSISQLVEHVSDKKN